MGSLGRCYFVSNRLVARDFGTFYASKHMKAVRTHRFVVPEEIELEDASIPQCKHHKILVKVAAAGVNPMDCKIVNGFFKSVRSISHPHLVGFDYSGTIEIIHPDLSRKYNLKVGDPVYGFLTDYTKQGSFANYIIVDPSYDAISPKPSCLSHGQAASTGLAAHTAYQTLIDYAGFKKGASQNICIIGASGGVGSFAIQFCKLLDPSCRVTAICSARNASYVRGLGADDVVDYTQAEEVQDLAIFLKCLPRAKNYDIVLDCVGGDVLFRTVTHELLSDNGVYASIVGPKTYGGSGMTLSNATVANAKLLWRSMTSRVNYKLNLSQYFNCKRWSEVHAILSEGRMQWNITPRDPQEIALALTQVSSNHTVGKIVLIFDAELEPDMWDMVLDEQEARRVAEEKRRLEEFLNSKPEEKKKKTFFGATKSVLGAVGKGTVSVVTGSVGAVASGVGNVAAATTAGIVTASVVTGSAVKSVAGKTYDGAATVGSGVATGATAVKDTTVGAGMAVREKASSAGKSLAQTGSMVAHGAAVAGTTVATKVGLKSQQRRSSNGSAHSQGSPISSSNRYEQNPDAYNSYTLPRDTDEHVDDDDDNDHHEPGRQRPAAAAAVQGSPSNGSSSSYFGSPQVQRFSLEDEDDEHHGASDFPVFVVQDEGQSHKLHNNQAPSRQEIEAEVRQQLEQELREEIEEDLRGRLEAELREELAGELDARVESALGDRLGALEAEICEQAEAEMERRDRLHEQELARANAHWEALLAQQRERENEDGDLQARELAQKEEELAEKQDQLKAQEAELNAKAENLDHKEADLAEREADLAQKESQLDSRAEELAEQEAQLAEKEAQLGQMEARLGEKEAELAENEAALAEKDAALDERAAELRQREEEARGELERSGSLLQDQMRAELRAELSRELRAELAHELRAELAHELRAELAQELKGQVEADLRSELEAGVRAQLQEELRAELRGGVEDELRRSLEGTVRAELRAELAASSSSPLNSSSVVVGQQPAATYLAVSSASSSAPVAAAAAATPTSASSVAEKLEALRKKLAADKAAREARQQQQ